MGQFYSRNFNGDPYMSMMRAMPEKEIIWWLQQAIFLVEGYTFLGHFCRTYPNMFLHKCPHCNGAGTITCPSCQGFKLKTAIRPLANLRSGSTAKALPLSEAQPCALCGPQCEWDHESEWEGKWKDWERKLTYYDQTYAPLFKEWYGDLMQAGQLDEDSAPSEDEYPRGRDLSDPYFRQQAEFAKDKKRMELMMRRFGVPYSKNEVLGYEVVDPTAEIGVNVWNMAQVFNTLPPELNPEAFPEFLRMEVNPIDAFDMQIAQEADIMRNLDAAIKDAPKPAAFGPTAGTVTCPDCQGEPYHYSIFPNLAKLTRTETPFWTRTVQRMGRHWYAPEPGAAESASTSGRTYGEYGPRRALQQQLEAEAEPLERIAGRNESTERYRPELERMLAEEAATTEPSDYLARVLARRKLLGQAPTLSPEQATQLKTLVQNKYGGELDVAKLEAWIRSRGTRRPTVRQQRPEDEEVQQYLGSRERQAAIASISGSGRWQ